MRRDVIGGVAAAAAGVLMALAPNPAGAVPPAQAPHALASAPIAGCDATSIAATGDLDGDGVPEVVVGMPTYPGGGGVDVRYTKGGGTVLTAASLGVWTPDDRRPVRGAVVVTDLNGDRCADLVIGAPGRAGTGAVVIALGSPTGYRAVDARVVASPTLKAGSAFGSSLAVLTTGLSGGGTGPVVVAGMPGYPLGSRAAAGALVAVEAPGGVPGAVSVATEDTAGVAGVAEAGDRFGSVLAAATSASTLLVGVPLEDVGSVVDAGSVSAVTFASWGQWAGASYSENTTSMPGTAETGDHFGAAVVSGGLLPVAGTITVGVPGEDSGSVRDVGTIVSFVPNASGVGAATVVHQSGTWEGSAVPGANEAGDAFGSALAWQDVALDIQTAPRRRAARGRRDDRRRGSARHLRRRPRDERDDGHLHRVELRSSTASSKRGTASARPWRRVGTPTTSAPSRSAPGWSSASRVRTCGPPWTPARSRSPTKVSARGS